MDHQWPLWSLKSWGGSWGRPDTPSPCSEHLMPPLSCVISASWGRAQRVRRPQSGEWLTTATPSGDAQVCGGWPWSPGIWLLSEPRGWWAPQSRGCRWGGGASIPGDMDRREWPVATATQSLDWEQGAQRRPGHRLTAFSLCFSPPHNPRRMPRPSELTPMFPSPGLFQSPNPHPVWCPLESLKCVTVAHGAEARGGISSLSAQPLPSRGGQWGKSTEAPLPCCLHSASSSLGCFQGLSSCTPFCAPLTGWSCLSWPSGPTPVYPKSIKTDRAMGQW